MKKLMSELNCQIEDNALMSKTGVEGPSFEVKVEMGPANWLIPWLEEVMIKFHI